MTCDWSQETRSRNRKFVIGSNSKFSWFQIKVETEKWKSILNFSQTTVFLLIISYEKCNIALDIAELGHGSVDTTSPK